MKYKSNWNQLKYLYVSNYIYNHICKYTHARGTVKVPTGNSIKLVKSTGQKKDTTTTQKRNIEPRTNQKKINKIKSKTNSKALADHRMDHWVHQRSRTYMYMQAQRTSATFRFLCFIFRTIHLRKSQQVKTRASHTLAGLGIVLLLYIYI